MLVCYGLAMAHCRLELLPGFQFLSCCEHQDTAPHQDDDCQQDACSVVESGFCKTSDHDEVVPVPLFMLCYELSVVETENAAGNTSAEVRSSAPPELSRNWQFSFRTALPPRAPSPLA